MADDLRVRVSSDVSGFKEGFEDAGRTVEDFQHKVDGAKKSTVDFGQKGKMSTKDLISEISKMTGAERHLTNYRRQLAQMTKDIQDLTVNYRAMSEEMKDSDIGKATLERINELTKKAGEYKDAVMDAQQSIKVLASDTANWDAAKQGINALSGALQSIISLGVLGKKSTDDLVKVIAKLQAVEKGFNGVIAVTNALQKQSALMQGIMRVQTAALTKATTMQTGATVAQTIAQKAFNVVAKANPYVLLASAIIAVGTALIAFTKKTKEAEAAEKKHQEQLEKEKEAMEHFVDSVGSPVGTAMAKFNQLGEAYRGLSTKMEKTQFIKDNQKAFEDLGISISNLGDADNVFINNTEAFERAIMQRARAAALYNLIVENFQSYAKEIEKINKMEAPFKSGQIIDENRAGMLGHKQDYWTLGSSDRHMGTAYVQLNESGAELLNEEWRQRQRAAAEKALLGANSDLQKQITEANSAFNAILSQYGIKASGGSGTGKGGQGGIEAQVGSLAAAQAEVSKLQLVLNNMSPDNEAFEQTKQKLAEAKAEVERIQTLINGTKTDAFEGVEGSLDEANWYVSHLTKELNALDPGTDKFKEVLSLLTQWKQKQKEITDTINGTVTATETVVDKYDKIVKQRNDIQKKFEIGAISFEDAQSQINALNEQLKNLGLTATVKLDIDKESIKTTSDKMKDFVSTMDKVGSISNAVSAINSIYDSIKNLGSTLKEAESGWEAFFAVFQTGMTIFEAVASIIEVIATVTELLSAAKTANAAATTTETAATTADATAQAADAAATTTNAAAHGAAAAAEAGQSVASIPYVGPVLAIAAIVAVMAAVLGILASAKGFTEGGVVGGHSYTGDKILARLNSGEIILNQRQQANLLEQLDRDTIISSHDGASINIPDKITLTAHGSDMEAVLTNVLNKKSKI